MESNFFFERRVDISLGQDTDIIIRRNLCVPRGEVTPKY